MNWRLSSDHLETHTRDPPIIPNDVLEVLSIITNIQCRVQRHMHSIKASLARFGNSRVIEDIPISWMDTLLHPP